MRSKSLEVGDWKIGKKGIQCGILGSLLAVFICGKLSECYCRHPKIPLLFPIKLWQSSDYLKKVWDRERKNLNRNGIRGFLRRTVLISLFLSITSSVDVSRT